jgi:glycosyltransferase involved in cell wall biosynthesis
MKFSIVIPAYNGEAYLALAIKSALEQSRPADEVVVVDDASTDRTAEIAQSQEWKRPVKYFHCEKSSGFVEAWNRAIHQTSGDFVSILHQDDLLSPDYLHHMEEALLRHPHVKHLYAACTYIDENGSITKMPPEPHSLEPVLYTGQAYARNYLDGVVTNNHIHRCPGVTTSRELLANDCTYRSEAGHIADDDFFLRVGAYTDVVGISHPLASFRHHAKATTSRLDLLSLNLARDYVFQSRYHKENETLLGEGDSAKIHQQAVRFINLLLFQSLLYKKEEWTTKALELRIEFNEIYPDFFDKNLPKWARPLWKIVSASNPKNRTAALYVNFLNGFIKARDYVSSITDKKTLKPRESKE